MEFQWLLNVFIAPAIWLARAKPGRGAIAESLVLVRRCTGKSSAVNFPRRSGYRKVLSPTRRKRLNDGSRSSRATLSKRLSRSPRPILTAAGAAGGPANDRAHTRKSRGWGPRDPDNPARRLFLPAKNNVAQDVGGLAFSVEPFTLPSGIETSRILWERDPVSMTADEAMQPPPENGERTMTEDAVELLRAILTNGPLLARDIKRQATDAGISDKTLRTARQRLNVTVDREGFGATQRRSGRSVLAHSYPQTPFMPTRRVGHKWMTRARVDKAVRRVT